MSFPTEAVTPVRTEGVQTQTPSVREQSVQHEIIYPTSNSFWLYSSMHLTVTPIPFSGIDNGCS